ncbi:MAG: CPBP family intramembrane metalloprotease [Planctomycetes bacterium]|nr:CPBP family intramembrane metalloprotease [Planctomycetota bacterium]
MLPAVVAIVAGGLAAAWGAQAAAGAAQTEAAAVLEAGADAARRAEIEAQLTEGVETLLLRVWVPAMAICLAATVGLAAAVRRRLAAATAFAVGIYPLLGSVLLAVFCMMAFYASGGFLAVGLERSWPEMRRPLIALLAPGISLCLAMWICRRALHCPLLALGLHRRRAVAAIAWSLLLFAAQLPVCYALIALSSVIVAPRLQEEVVEIATHSGWLYRGLFLLAVVGAVPLFEEVVFRGLLFEALRRRLGVGVGVVVSALLFTAVHPVETYLPIFWLGVMLALAYHYTGTLLAPIALHAVHNGVQFVLILWASSGGGG